MRGVISFRGLLEVVVFVLTDLGEFANSLLQLVQIVFSCFDSLVELRVFPFLVAVAFAETVDLLLIAAAFLLKFLQLEVGSIDVLAERVGVIALALAVALVPENFGFPAGDLLSQGRDLGLHIVISTALVVEVVASIVAFFLETVQSDAVGVLTGLELVLLQQLLVLKVAVLGLNCVKLVPQC